jgi:AbrB family looped-hinge helix DNA binding protein
MNGLTPAIFHGIFNGMSSSVTMDSAGRLVLPRKIREQLNLHGGSRLNLELEKDSVRLVPMPEEEARIVMRNGRHVIETSSPLGVGEIRKAILAEREERLVKLSSKK